MITQEMLSAPVALHYTEGNETFTVNAAGLIGRPAIHMKPSGGWRFTGLANHHGTMLATFPELVRGLIGGGDLPEKGGHVLDLDHGTHRMHGNRIEGIWLAGTLHADDLLALVDRLDRERREAEAAAEAVAAEVRLQAAKGAPVLYSDLRFGVFLHRFKRRPEGFTGEGPAFAVVDGETATEPLEYRPAMAALGAALLEAAESAGEDSGDAA